MVIGVFSSFRSYFLASLALTTLVISHAVYMKRFFYRSMVYLSASKIAILAVGNMALVSVILVWRLIQSIFLGPLRFREVERLHVRAREAIIECCFATTIFREEVNLKFLALVTTLLMLKSMHWLAKDRIDFLEEQPLSPTSAHVRIIGLIALLFTIDSYLIIECAKGIFKSKGGTMLVLFAFEFTVLLIELVSDFVRYLFHVIDLYLEGRWEAKGLFSFYNELVSDLCQLTLYLAFFIYVHIFYTFPLHIIRELYITFTKFRRRCSDFIRYRRVVSTMNDLFADATEEELAEGDRTCIICREEMPSAKKLACGHMFHGRCLQSWLKRQLSCPTCRANVDVNTPAANASNMNNAAPRGDQLPGAAVPGFAQLLRPARGEPGQAQPGQAQPGQAQPGQVQPALGQPAPAQPAQPGAPQPQNRPPHGDIPEGPGALLRYVRLIVDNLVQGQAPEGDGPDADARLPPFPPAGNGNNQPVDFPDNPQPNNAAEAERTRAEEREQLRAFVNARIAAVAPNPAHVTRAAAPHDLPQQGQGQGATDPSASREERRSTAHRLPLDSLIAMQEQLEILREQLQDVVLAATALDEEGVLVQEIEEAEEEPVAERDQVERLPVHDPALNVVRSLESDSVTMSNANTQVINRGNSNSGELSAGTSSEERKESQAVREESESEALRRRRLQFLEGRR